MKMSQTTNFQFDNELKGEMLPEARAGWEMTKKGMLSMDILRPGGFTLEKLEMMRKGVEAMFTKDSDSLDKCESKLITIDGTKYGSDNDSIDIYVNKVKGVEEKNRPAMVYFHGGAVVAGTAKAFQNFACKLAIIGNMTTFNVDFRNAPETKAPGNYKDCYAALKFVTEEAERFNLDSRRICIGGESGGGYLSTAVCMELARHDEADLVKFAWVDIPMIHNHWITKEVELHECSSFMVQGHIEGLKFLAPKWDEDTFTDPDIFPGLMDDQLLAKVPPTLLTTREFDYFRHDAELYSKRLEKHGKLLQPLYIQPGTTHMSCLIDSLPSSKAYFEDLARMFMNFI